MSNLRIDVPPAGIYLAGRNNPKARLLNASIGSGEAGLPIAEFLIEPGTRLAGRYELKDISLIGFDQSECEIVIAGDSGDRIAHYGIVSARQATLDQSGDSIKFISRLEPHHFGYPLKEATH